MFYSSTKLCLTTLQKLRCHSKKIHIFNKMKRVREEYVSDHTRSKRPRLNPGLQYNIKKCWVTPSQLRNYMIKDPLVDWLELYAKNSTIGNNYSGGVPNNEFIEFIKNKGIEFENKLIRYINDHKTPIVTISEYITQESVNRARKLIREGVPVLHSVPLQSNKLQMRGIADLVVRSDYLGKIIEDNPLTPDQEHAEALGRPYHYVVIDIKFSTLPLRADGRHLLNSGNYPAYKSQLWVYNRILGNIQGYTPDYAFILGRRWNYRSCDIKYNSIECLNKLGVVDFKGVDSEYIQRTEDAVEWYRTVRQNGKDWQVTPVPSRPELYPNMCVDSGKWNKQKHTIANDIGEITSVWNVGIKHREKALVQNVKSWKDQRCTSKILGINGVRGPVINEILKINRQNEDKIRPKRISSNMYNWKKVENEIFVDFETLLDIFSPFDELPKQGHTNQIFMIGVWYRNKIGWSYMNFICRELSPEEEFRIMNEFYKFVKVRKYPKMWFWHAEKNMWSQAEKRQFDQWCEFKRDEKRLDIISDKWKNVGEWCDMAKLFREEPIVIKGCFKFGLKEIVNAMNKHGLIKTQMESECNSGTVAAVKAWNAYNKYSDVVSSPPIQDISKYNEFDVKALYDIILYLRKNNI